MQKVIPILDRCTLSDFREGEVLVDRFDQYLKKHHDLVFPHRHNFFHLVLFTGGGGQHFIDFQPFEVTAWQIYFMTPGQVHTWEFSEEMKGYVVNFSLDFFQSFLLRSDYLESFRFFSGIASDSVIQLPDPVREEIGQIFEKLVAEFEAGRQAQADLLRILLLQLFILTEKSSPDRQLNPIPDYHLMLLRNFQKLIERHYNEKRLPRDYADLLFITPNHLNAVCKEHLGIQAGEAIRNRVLLEAKRLLVNQQTSISEIAYQLNFNDNSYFTKFFKKLVGITPEEFRKKAK